MPQLEPNATYETTHLIARDLLADIAAQLSDSVLPDDPRIRWQHVRMMNRLNALLSEVADQVDALNGRNR